MHEKLNALYCTRLLQWLERVQGAVFRPCADVEASIAVTDHRLRFEEKNSLHYKRVEHGQVWGRAWQSAWFELHAHVSEKHAGECIA